MAVVNVLAVSRISWHFFLKVIPNHNPLKLSKLWNHHGPSIHSSSIDQNNIRNVEGRVWRIQGNFQRDDEFGPLAYWIQRMNSIHWCCPIRSPESSVLKEEEVTNILHTGKRHFHHKKVTSGKVRRERREKRRWMGQEYREHNQRRQREEQGEKFVTKLVKFSRC